MSWGFQTLVADPGWRFDDRLGRRGAEYHYRPDEKTGRSTMSLEEIKAFPLPPLTTNCRLFLWRVASMQEQALEVVQAWGFSPVKTELVWVKTTAPFEKPEAGMLPNARMAFGMGRTTRAAHETCLIAVRGRPPRLSASIRSVFFAPVREHSEKPEEFYQIVRDLSPGPYVELFAREERPGWVCYGLEVGTPYPGAKEGL